MPAHDPFDAFRPYRRNKALIDAMEAHKVLSPAASATARSAGRLSPLAASIMSSATTSGFAKVAGQHAGTVELAAGLKRSGATTAAETGRQATGLSAAEKLRRATLGYAASAPRIDVATDPGMKLARMMRSSLASIPSADVPMEPTLPAPPPRIPSINAQMLKLQREIDARRAEEHAIEVERHEQSLAVQQAMYEALRQSEAARAADSEAAALREQAIVDRADKRQAKALRVAVLGVGIAVLTPVAQIVLPTLF